MRLRALCSALLLAFSTTITALGQDGKVVLQFVTFPKTLEPVTMELLGGKGKTTVVEIPSNELSVPYRVNARESWALGETVEGKDGKPKFAAHGRAKSLGAPKQLILVIRKGKDPAQGVKLVPFDNRAGKFGGGSFLFVNAASVPIAGQVGNKKLTLAPGKTAVIKPQPDRGKNLCQATLYYRANKQARPFLDTAWPLDPGARGLIFVYNDPGTARIRLHTIRDFL